MKDVVGTERRPLRRDALEPLKFVFPAALAFYFLLHLLIRINLSDSLELDEAEAVFHSQRPAWGYGSQPPLYNWLQWLFFSVFGLNLFALALLKNLLLAATYLCTWFLARPLIGIHAATAAASSLILFPQIGWESQRDLTHSVLLTCVASATLWGYFALLRNPARSRFALLGLLVGLGLIAKYNYVIFLGGLVAASVVVGEHRRIVWNRNLLVSAAVTLAVVLPHGLWLLHHLGAASAGTLRKMAEGTRDAGYFANAATGLLSLSVAILGFAWVLTLVYALASRPWWKQLALERRSPHARFFLSFYTSCLALLLVVVLTGEVGKIKDRWIEPLLFSLPVALFVLLPALPRKAMLIRVSQVVAGLALAILLLIPARVLIGPMLGKYVRQHYPYPELSDELTRRFPHVEVVVAGGTLLAGNLHFQHPEWQTWLLKDVLAGDATPARKMLVVMPENAEAGWMERLRAALPSAEVRRQGRLTLNYRFGSSETTSYDYFLVGMESH